jgi:hypothetical protein
MAPTSTLHGSSFSLHHFYPTNPLFPLRLPRRYSNDKNRDASAPIVGTSGSTPLHFAAANGNTEVVTVLLLHGAHADRPDKHGVTPEILARQNGWVECAQVLKDWILNKDSDLREREGRTTIDSQTLFATKRGPSGPPFQDIDTSPPPSRRRLHVKQSIDTALNMLKSSSSSHADGRLTAPQGTPPSSPQKPFVEYTFYPDDGGPVHPGSRRPSLPHITQLPADEPSPNYKHPSIKGISNERRPRSAGTGADCPQDHEMMYAPYGRGGSARKLGSKYSLLNIFKKAHHGEGTESPQPDTILAREPSDSDFSPLSGSALTLPLSSSYNSNSAQQSNIDLHDHYFVQTNTPSSSSSPFSRAGFRFHRSSDASSKVRTPSHLHQPQFPPQTEPSPSGGLQHSPPLATDLHNVLANQRPRSRSDASVTDQSDMEGLASSNSSPLSPLQTGRVDASIALDDSKPLPRVGILDDDSADFGTNPDMGSGKTSPRPGILRSHNHSPVGQGTIPPRALRFDSTSSGSAGERKGKDSRTESPRRMELRSSNSAGSLRTSKLRDLAHQRGRAGSPARVPSSPDGQVYNYLNSLTEGAQQNERNDSTYGLPIHFGPIVDIEGGDDLKPPTALLLRERGTSFTNSSQSSLSPILSNENATETRADFPFSINRPAPPVHQEDEGYAAPQPHLAVPTSQDNRTRGDSLSSNSTADSSVYPQLSISGTTGSGSSVTISTPGAGSYLALLPSSNVSFEEEYQAHGLGKESSLVLGENLSVGSRGGNLLETRSNLNERRFHPPLDIDISTISSHAQAEALVQRARQDVLDLANGQEDSPGTATTGRTPLSARLAAYGESLALERKLRQQVEAQLDDTKKSHTGDVISPRSPLTPDDILLTPVSNKKSRDGLERQLSLEHKSGASKIRLRARDPRRPSTAEGREFSVYLSPLSFC